MNREREAVLMRLNRLSQYSTTENTVPDNLNGTVFNKKALGSMTIEAAIGFWSQDEAVYVQDETDPKQQKTAKAMSSYARMLEEAKKASPQETDAYNVREAQSREVELFNQYIGQRMSAEIQSVPIDFDILDKNRSDACLLYSYDRRGRHSTLAQF